MIGLTFQESRNIVSESLRDAVNRIKNERVEYLFRHVKENLVSIVTYIVIMLLAIILLLIAIADCPYDIYYELVICAGIIIFVSLANLIFYAMTQEAKEGEVILALQKTLDEFDSALQLPATPAKELGNDSLDFDILAGHAQISIVSCYRNGEWHRVPTLLLAKGDIIALQCGDITPGKCYEVNAAVLGSGVDLSNKTALAVDPNIFQKPQEQQNNTEPQEPPNESIFSKSESDAILPYEVFKSLAAPNEISSVKEEALLSSVSESAPTAFSMPANTTVLEKGTKIFRSSDSTSKPSHVRRNLSFQRHRALASDGVELLALSGDMRCFQMLSTPVEAYVDGVMDGYKKKDKSQRLSLIHMFLIDVLKRSIPVLLVIVALFIIAAIIKFSLLPTARYHWNMVFTTPLAAILISFVPLFLPTFLILADAILTANFLATTEAMILDDSSSKSKRTSSKSAKARKTAEGGTHAKGGHHNPNHRAFNKNQSSVKHGLQMFDSDLECGIADGGSEQSSLNNISEDEFRDEDIDERVEELAEEASHRVLWTRVIEYVLIVLCRRLNLKWIQRFLSHWISVEHMLSIPPSKSKLLEFLGGITMVCFIDDDVICEGFSVSEEIFLLKNTEQRDATGFNSALSESHGVILDLHSNPEAHGSRFENPNWWKYLPSLKPIGLNAMLTYAPMPVLTTSSMGSGTLTAENLKEQELLRDPTNSSRIKKNHGHHKKSHNMSRHLVEKSLVTQVRKSIPLESLRELAEEIGFASEDVQVFRKVLEMNVIAPGLLDAKLMEDTHAWGQEETRRRGSLMTQVRSSVVLDSRSGGLQIMSQGDPALILHYCSDYWDGKSIAPFTSNDRTEILSVYDRWNLEDFDVVAFAYTPISIDLRKRILQSQNIDMDGLNWKTGVRKRSNSVAHANANANANAESNSFDKIPSSQSSTTTASSSIYIVDPYTSQDLQLMRKQYLEAVNSVKAAAINSASDQTADFTRDSSLLLTTHAECEFCEEGPEDMLKVATPTATPEAGLASPSLFALANPDLLYDMKMLKSQTSVTDNAGGAESEEMKPPLQDESLNNNDTTLDLVAVDDANGVVEESKEGNQDDKSSTEPMKLMNFFRGELDTFNISLMPSILFIFILYVFYFIRHAHIQS